MASTHSNYISTTELARWLGLSPATVFKRIKKGKIQAQKIGRSYAISKTYIQETFPAYQFPSEDQKDYLSIIQAAEILGISRIAVYKKIKNNTLAAKRVGRHFVILKSELIKENRELSRTHPALQRDHLSVVEFAQITGISRITIFNRIKKGMIKAHQVGRHYVIAREDVPVEGVLLAKAAISAERYLSVAQVAKKLGISRIAVFKKIKKGQIKAQRMGRSYAILKEELRSKEER